MITLLNKYLIYPITNQLKKAWDWFWGSQTAIFFTCTVILPIVGIATAGPSGPPFSQLLSFVFSIIGPFIFIIICLCAIIFALAIIRILLG